MNIIVPKDEKVGYFVLDLRDALEGREMNFYGKEDALPEWVVVVPKKYLQVTEKGDYNFKLLRNYIREELENMDNHPQRDFIIERLMNIEMSLRMGKKVITIPKGKDCVTVSAPLWNSSVQLIDVVIKNPIFPSEGNEKYIDVTDAGICDAEKVLEVIPDCQHGNGVMEVLERVHLENRNHSKYEDEEGFLL